MRTRGNKPTTLSAPDLQGVISNEKTKKKSEQQKKPILALIRRFFKS
jgi:hypothetical protein